MAQLVPASAPFLQLLFGPVTREQWERNVCGFIVVGGEWVRERFTDLPWCWRCGEADVASPADRDGGYSCEQHPRCYAFGCLVSERELLNQCPLRASFWRFCKPYCVQHCWCASCCAMRPLKSSSQ